MCFRFGGIPALDFWDLIYLVFGNTTQTMIERDNSLLAVTQVTSQVSNLEECSMF